MSSSKIVYINDPFLKSSVYDLVVKSSSLHSGSNGFFSVGSILEYLK